MKADVTPPTPPHRFALLIAALGGQGGGVLADWIVAAARSQGLAAQATSTPGVSQRTGATTYYIEIAAACAGRPPVLGLAPMPGRVDVLVCAELLEAARMLERGMSAPSRTTIVASTHRVYTTRETMNAADARFDSARIVDALRALSRRAVHFDMDAIRARHGTAISAALLGALAGSDALPIGRGACEAAIRDGERGVAASLAAFAEAFDRARAADAPRPIRDGAAEPLPEAATADPVALPAQLAARIDALPARVADLARVGAAQLIEFQGVRYAHRYVDRVLRIAAAGRVEGAPADAVACEAARCLALWMRYDDAIRVASRKARASRLARIRAEAGAGTNDVVRVHDFFKPGVHEIAALLPRGVGIRLERRARAPAAAPDDGGSRGGAGLRITLQTSSIAGALALRLVAALRPLRPHSLRYGREQQAIERWLAAIEQALALDCRDAAQALASLPRLNRGYGDTHAAGRAKFERILDAWRTAAEIDPVQATRTLCGDTVAAFNDPACGPRRRPEAAAAARAGGASLPA
jgi:indolepyruvate ferredoxin oxidoreductase beta subunit